MFVSWQQALELALLLVVVWMGLLVVGDHRVRRWVVEIIVLLLCFGAWQWGLGRFANHVAGAASHGLWVWRAEKWLHLPSERSAQRLALRAPWVVRDLNYYYAVAHVQDVLACLVWLWVRHRDRYVAARRALVLATAGSLLLQTIPVAPPRLLPATGVVDAGRLLGYAVYSSAGLRDAGQVIAMPSVHCLFAAWVATVVVRSSSSRWRWLVVLHPALTTAAVMLAGYHFWLDVVVAEVLVAAAVELVERAGPRIGRADPDNGRARGGNERAGRRARRPILGACPIP